MVPFVIKVVEDWGGLTLWRRSCDPVHRDATSSSSDEDTDYFYNSGNGDLVGEEDEGDLAFRAVFNPVINSGQICVEVTEENSNAFNGERIANSSNNSKDSLIYGSVRILRDSNPNFGNSSSQPSNSVGPHLGESIPSSSFVEDTVRVDNSDVNINGPLVSNCAERVVDTLGHERVVGGPITNGADLPSIHSKTSSEGPKRIKKSRKLTKVGVE